ncbi:MAG: 30S ribosomal protein S12 methylthiotransferase RimO [Candidatus Eisenbacteria bacterium]|nr:30S ribosomal protein S12 methylthiotransferase RimO [Candidatus Eisenbacteria bacterium]
MRIPKIAVVTLGCAKNLADTDLLAGQILNQGIAIAADPSEADAIIVNTCAFLTASQRESIDTILEMAEHKRVRPGRRLIVVGCLAQRHGGDLMREIPEIDMIVGPGEVHSLAPRLRSLLDEGPDGDRIHLGGFDRVEERWDLRVVSQLSHSAYVKISEGCDRTCAFCVIPALRGPHRSRSLESIVEEARRLAGSGVRELNLVAQELTAWGADLDGKPSLPRLLEALNEVEGVRWIRLLYAYPSPWTADLIRCFRDLPRLAPYLDMPIQHVSERILRRMRRPPFGSTVRLLERFRAEVPGIALRTTLISGFPGETQEEHEEMLAFVRSFGFDHLGVFAYSTEEGTVAGAMEGQLPLRLREQRRRGILAAQREASVRRHVAWKGRRVEVLLDRSEKPGVWVGRHAGQAPEVDGVTRLRAGDGWSPRAGEFVEAEVVSAGPYDLSARPVARPGERP